MQEIYHETEQMLARGRMELPLSLCFAATRGDDLLLHQLLRRSLDPDEGDENGRRPLVKLCYFDSESTYKRTVQRFADLSSRSNSILQQLQETNIV